jgi:hypothetical protein
MDNAEIHYNNKLIALLKKLEYYIVLFPSYSFNKAYDNPIYVLLVTCSQITF